MKEKKEKKPKLTGSISKQALREFLDNNFGSSRVIVPMIKKEFDLGK